MRQAFHGSNNQASHRNPRVRRIPGKAGICGGPRLESVRDVAVVSATEISARAARDILFDWQQRARRRSGCP
jgi:hypothetical protein